MPFGLVQIPRDEETGFFLLYLTPIIGQAIAGRPSPDIRYYVSSNIITIFANMINRELYMSRALGLASNGELHASPNPMVGAVIVAPDGRIIGEGWHRRCGEGHAEVNAVASVSEADRPLLRQSTMFVTLEPCSHYGKTPPCARLILDTGIPRVEVATVDPFARVAGRGIAMLREGGVDVRVGLLGEEARRLNRRFFGAHTRRRPWVTLKWAQSADGFIDGRDSESDSPAAISTPLTRAAVHRERALNQAIIVGSGTVIADSPSLTVRDYAGDSPQRFVLDRRGRLSERTGWTILSDPTPEEAISRLYSDFGIISVLVEGGATLLNSFIATNLWDEARIEVNPSLRLAGTPRKIAAPEFHLPALPTSVIDGHSIYRVFANPDISINLKP